MRHDENPLGNRINLSGSNQITEVTYNCRAVWEWNDLQSFCNWRGHNKFTCRARVGLRLGWWCPCSQKGCVWHLDRPVSRGCTGPRRLRRAGRQRARGPNLSIPNASLNGKGVDHPPSPPKGLRWQHICRIIKTKKGEIMGA